MLGAWRAITTCRRWWAGGAPVSSPWLQSLKTVVLITTTCAVGERKLQ
jgi:hypothetical protein